LPGKNTLNLLETFVNCVGKQFNSTGPGINIVTNTANAKSYSVCPSEVFSGSGSNQSLEGLARENTILVRQVNYEEK